jgi:hypothetical protein
VVSGSQGPEVAREPVAMVTVPIMVEAMEHVRLNVGVICVVYAAASVSQRMWSNVHTGC